MFGSFMWLHLTCIPCYAPGIFGWALPLHLFIGIPSIAERAANHMFL